MLKVGDTIYKFDINRRVYDKPGLGGRPIYKEHFEPHIIVSETAQSWLITSGYGVVKINKKTMHQSAKNGWNGYQWYDAKAMEDNIWLNNHKYKIIELIQRANPDQLRAIAKIIGYNSETVK